jgi:hypothetical protein
MCCTGVLCLRYDGVLGFSYCYGSSANGIFIVRYIQHKLLQYRNKRNMFFERKCVELYLIALLKSHQTFAREKKSSDNPGSLVFSCNSEQWSALSGRSTNDALTKMIHRPY